MRGTAAKCIASFAVIITALSAVAASGSAVKVGERAPLLMLRDLSGKMVFLSDFCGRICSPANRRNTVVHFFATTCRSCMREIPAIKRLRAFYGEGRLAILMISVGEDKKRVIEYRGRYGINATFLLDKFAGNARRWGICKMKGKSTRFKLPYTFLLDKMAIVRAVFPGARENLDELIRNELKRLPR